MAAFGRSRARARSSRTDRRQDLVPLALHQLGRPRLEVQPQQRLGVRRPDVHVPLARVNRDAVQVADLALAAELLLELAELAVDVRDRGVELTGQEVMTPVGGEDLRELGPPLRDELEHEQERHDARVGLRKLPEVVVARDLTAEGRTFLAHPVLDERMADAVDEWDAAGALDGLRYGPTRAQVVDDLRAR